MCQKIVCMFVVLKSTRFLTYGSSQDVNREMSFSRQHISNKSQRRISMRQFPVCFRPSLIEYLQILPLREWIEKFSLIISSSTFNIFTFYFDFHLFQWFIVTRCTQLGFEVMCGQESGIATPLLPNNCAVHTRLCLLIYTSTIYPPWNWTVPREASCNSFCWINSLGWWSSNG